MQSGKKEKFIIKILDIGRNSIIRLDFVEKRLTNRNPALCENFENAEIRNMHDSHLSILFSTYRKLNFDMNHNFSLIFKDKEILLQKNCTNIINATLLNCNVII